VEPVQYTAADDASWAIFSTNLSDILAPDKQALYDHFIEGCTKRGLGESCAEDDEQRMEMNRDQPSSVHNYTHAGYQKIRAPSELFELIHTFWETNKERAEVEWKETNTYHNMWDAPTDILKLANVKHTGGGSALEKKIFDFARPVVEEWTGQKLKPVSCYGIRVYHGGSILASHVDRMPLVTSMISK
jgi:prolyl 4-hydroxylase